jgi:hypothetical protein
MTVALAKILLGKLSAFFLKQFDHFLLFAGETLILRSTTTTFISFFELQGPYSLQLFMG